MGLCGSDRLIEQNGDRHRPDTAWHWGAKRASGASERGRVRRPTQEPRRCPSGRSHRAKSTRVGRSTTSGSHRTPAPDPYSASPTAWRASSNSETREPHGTFRRGTPSDGPESSSHLGPECLIRPVIARAPQLGIFLVAGPADLEAEVIECGGGPPRDFACRDAHGTRSRPAEWSVGYRRHRASITREPQRFFPTKGMEGDSHDLTFSCDIAYPVPRRGVRRLHGPGRDR